MARTHGGDSQRNDPLRTLFSPYADRSSGSRFAAMWRPNFDGPTANTISCRRGTLIQINDITSKILSKNIGGATIFEEEIKMKTALFLSTVAAGLLAVSTVCFAQNWGNYPQAYGDSQGAFYYAMPKAFSPSDFGYQRRVTPLRHHVHPSAAHTTTTPVPGPAPAQESD
jgi:hypothetical protein